jgi:hypothetical protein
VNWWVWLLHVSAVVFGAFFIINLALAVLYLFFSKDRQKRECGVAWQGRGRGAGVGAGV